MPVSASSNPQIATWTLRDNNNKSATFQIGLPAAFVPDAIASLAWLDSVTDAIIAASNCLVTSLVVSKKYGITGNTVGPSLADIPPESEVERKLQMTFETDLGTPIILSLPSPVFSVEVDGSDDIPNDAPLLAALIDLIVDGPLGPGNGPVSNQARPITAFRQAYVTHRNRARK